MDLKGIKIIELATVLAGPMVGSFFAEMGAQVVKFENKNSGGDVTRQWKTKDENPNNPISSYYASANYGKQVVLVDLKKMEDRELVYEAVKNADVVISNYKPKSAIKIGMDEKSLAQYNSKLIYACINGYGDDDPRPAFDAVLQAECGLMSMNGTTESGPLKWPLAMVDILAAHQLKEAILVALINRSKNNQGYYLNVSLYDSALSTLSNQGSDYLMNNHIPQRIGSLHPGIAPYGDTFVTEDGKHLLLAVGNDVQFKILCTILDLKMIPEDSRYKTNQKRVQNRSTLANELSIAIKRKHSKEIIHEMNELGVPGSLVLGLDEVFKNPNSKELILEEEIEGQMTKRMRSVVFKGRKIKANDC